MWNIYMSCNARRKLSVLMPNHVLLSLIFVCFLRRAFRCDFIICFNIALKRVPNMIVNSSYILGKFLIKFYLWSYYRFNMVIRPRKMLLEHFFFVGVQLNVQILLMIQNEIRGARRLVIGLAFKPICSIKVRFSKHTKFYKKFI